MGTGGWGCGRVVRMSRRVTGVNLVPICSFLVFLYLRNPGVLIPSEGNPGDQHRLSSLSGSLLLPHLSVAPGRGKECGGLAQHSTGKAEWREEGAARRLPPSTEGLFATRAERSGRSKRRPREHRIALPKRIFRCR